MFLHGTPSRHSLVPRAGAIAHGLTSSAAAILLLLLVACGESSAPGGGSERATLSGTVRAAQGSAALEGAQITVGQRQTTSDASGHFEMTDLPVGAVTVQTQRPGYLAVTTAVTLNAGANTHDFALDVQEIYQSGPYAMYLPAGVGPLQGTVISLGGGVTTSGFVTGGPLEPGNPVLEQSLQQLGLNLRALAKSSRVALLGTTTHGLTNSVGSDNELFAAISTFAGLSGHPEVSDAPVLTFGLDAGSLEALGLASRVSQRSIGVLVRVPTSMTELTAPAALAVPTFVMLAELDNATVNTSVQNVFLANRSRGGLWALAVEPGVHHAEATDRGNGANVSWINLALTLRLPAAPGDPLITLDQTSGWLGNQTTREIASWASYGGDRSTASWLLSESAATSWQALGTRTGAAVGVGVAAGTPPTRAAERLPMSPARGSAGELPSVVQRSGVVSPSTP